MDGGPSLQSVSQAVRQEPFKRTRVACVGKKKKMQKKNANKGKQRPKKCNKNKNKNAIKKCKKRQKTKSVCN